MAVAANSKSGFVLAGGQSSRMGRDKALLPFGKATLIEHIATEVFHTAGSVTIIGPPDRYAHLGFPVIADSVPDCGPLGGLVTALENSESEWNVLVACDMPGLTADFLNTLIQEASRTQADCVVPELQDRRSPLCAVYHIRCLAPARVALDHKLFKMQDFISSLNLCTVRITDPAPLRNVNTPVEWARS